MLKQLDSSVRLHLLLPTYNRAHMLGDTLKGLFSQGADKSLWHVTVVDNASTDQTVSLLEEYCLSKTNFDYVVNDSNIGLFGNLNKCMSLARTDKYMIVHSDDAIDRDLVESVLSFLGSHPGVDMCFGTCRAYFADTGQILPRWYRSKIIGDDERVLTGDEFLIALLSSGSNFIFAPTVVYDRRFFNDQLRYSTEYSFTSDLDLWFRVSLRMPKVGFLPIPQITCCIHSSRLSLKHADELRLEAIDIYEKYLTIVRENMGENVINSRLARFITLKLICMKLAVRFHLVPGFKTRRWIGSLIEHASDLFGNAGKVFR